MSSFIHTRVSKMVGGTLTTHHTPGISERRGAAATQYLHSGLKNADARTSGQAIDATRQYDAFGNLTTSSGSWPGPFGYAGGFGYQEDAESGLMLLGHRYYDSTTGRFLSKDPIGDGRNWYGYCDNVPLSYVDSNGLQGTLTLPTDPNDLLKAGWEKDPSHKDPRSVRFVSPDGKEALDFTKGQPGRYGWGRKDHYHRYKRMLIGDKWVKDKKGGKGGHYEPGDKITVDSGTDEDILRGNLRELFHKNQNRFTPLPPLAGVSRAIGELVRRYLPRLIIW